MKNSTTKRTRKALALFLLVVVTICLFTSSLLLPNKKVSADEVSDVSQIAQANELKQISDNMITVTREEYSDLHEYKYEPEIEAAMRDTGMTVGESLVDQVCYYQGLLATTTDEQEIEKINALIDGTKEILDTYQAIAIESEKDTLIEITEEYNNTSYAAVTPTIPTYNEINLAAKKAVPAAIAWFNASNYLLSAELLTQAWSNRFIGNYYPVNGNRVVGSQATYDFLNSDKTSDVIEYKIFSPDMFNTSTCYEEDLGFALHWCNVSRYDSYSTNITITDKYDFGVNSSQNKILADLVSIFEDAQKLGIISVYNLTINVDLADPLYLELISTFGDRHTVRVYNYSDKKINVVYNNKMCSPEDARTWTGLKHADWISVPAKGYTEVEIYENGIASHITFCHVRNGYKIITYADELYLDRFILNTTFEKRQHHSGTDGISIVTKVGGTWAIQFTNIYGQGAWLDYNSKMCNEGDAQNWTGLVDVKSYYLQSNESRIALISENFFATHIAARFITDSYEYYIYAHELNTTGTMAVGRRTAVAYKYLQLTNNGKKGSDWKIMIKNPLSYGIYVYYNSKMCYFNDAKNWTDLSDVKSKYIGAGSSAEVSISGNWFATSIAISYISNGKRIITYADGLSSNGSMNIYNNVI